MPQNLKNIYLLFVDFELKLRYTLLCFLTSCLFCVFLCVLHQQENNIVPVVLVCVLFGLIALVTAGGLVIISKSRRTAVNVPIAVLMSLKTHQSRAKFYSLSVNLSQTSCFNPERNQWSVVQGGGHVKCSEQSL